MNHVYIKVAIELIDSGGFFKALGDYVGEYRVEAQEVQDIGRCLKISFYTDLVLIKEGEDRQVIIDAELVDDKIVFTSMYKL